MSATTTDNISIITWIDADNELPDDETTVLIALSDGEAWTGFHNEGAWWFVTGEPLADAAGLRVTHWATFPLPPNQQGAAHEG